MFSLIVHFLATLYANGETTYTIDDDDNVTTVMVEREMFTLTEAANQAFATVHDKWEMNVCRSIGMMILLQVNENTVINYN